MPACATKKTLSEIVSVCNLFLPVPDTDFRGFLDATVENTWATEKGASLTLNSVYAGSGNPEPRTLKPDVRKPFRTESNSRMSSVSADTPKTKPVKRSLHFSCAGNGKCYYSDTWLSYPRSLPAVARPCAEQVLDNNQEEA